MEQPFQLVKIKPVIIGQVIMQGVREWVMGIAIVSQHLGLHGILRMGPLGALRKIW